MNIMYNKILFIFIFAVFIFYNRKKKPLNGGVLYNDYFNPEYYKEHNYKYFKNPKKNLIFVSIASFRDNEILHTLKTLFDNAVYPDNIRVGICEQNEYSDLSMKDITIYSQKKIRNSQIRFNNIPSNIARGPTFGRYLCSHLYEGEEYYMQIDSHMVFESKWDEIIINEFKNLKDDKAVITTYPTDINSKYEKDKYVPRLCRGNKHRNGMVMYEATLDLKSDIKYNKKINYVAAGFMFLKGDFLKYVKYDPYLPNLFQGEELIFSARLWTNGYNFYSPMNNIVSHHYYRPNRPKVWDIDKSNWNKIAFDTEDKVLYLLGVKNNINPLYKIHIDKYSVGTKRNINDYLNLIGYNKDPNIKHLKNIC